MKFIKTFAVADWSPMRILRLVFGVWALYQSIHDREPIVGLLGAWLLYQGITNTGCCGTGACYTPFIRRRRKPGRNGDVEFETIN